MKKIFLQFKESICLYGLLIFGFFLRLIYIFNFTKPELYLWSDAGGYDNRAMEMAKGIHVAFSTYWPPFFHMFLSLIYRPLVWLGLEIWRIKIDIIIFSIFYAIGFWCIYQITKKLFSQKIAFVVLAIVTFWYPFIFLNYLVMSENLFFPLLFLGLYILIVKPIKSSTGLWLGLFWGVAFLARPIFGLVLPFFVLWGLYYKIGRRLLINFVIVTSLIIFSMMLFNSYYTNGAEKSISSSGGFNFATVWCDAKTIEYTDDNGHSFWFGSLSNNNYPDSKKILTTVPFENQKYYYQMGLNCLKEHPIRLITNFSSVIKLFHSALFPAIGGIAGWETFRLIFKLLTGLLFIGSLSTIISISTGWLKVDPSTKKYLNLMALIVLSLLAITYFQIVGEERYLIPYAPLLIILSIPIVISLWKRGYLTDNIIFLSVLIVISIFIRTNLFDFQTRDYTHCLSIWYDFIKSKGLLSFQDNFSDYTPSYLYALGFSTLLPISKLYAIKIISIIFDYILAGFVFLIVKKKYKNNYLIPILSFIAVLFAPTIILNGAYWGQCDVIYTCLLVASVYFLLKNKPLTSLILYGISFSLKLQAIFLFPLFIILLLKKKIKLYHFLAIPLTYLITIIPAGLIGRSWKDLFLIYWQQAKSYRSLTLNAPSLYQWLPSGQFDLFYHAGLLFTAAIIIIFVYIVYKNKKEITNELIIKIAFFSVVLIPFLLPEMHERYFFPADVFSIIFAFCFPYFFFLPILMQIISFLSYKPFLWGIVPNFPMVSFLVLIVILIVAFDLFKSLKNKEINYFSHFLKVRKTEKLP